MSSQDTQTQTMKPNNFWIVIPSILLSIFLAALDQTITATALPTIVSDIGGASDYSWVGTAYLLASGCLAQFWGGLCGVVGTKPVYFFTMFLFLLGSGLCGAAESFTWLVICRGLQGAGGGGLIQLSMITISEITPLNHRGLYIGFVGAVWGIASVLGPSIGGLFASKGLWRWGFWVNLPIGLLCAVVQYVYLHLKSTPRQSIDQVIHTFDFVGLALIFSGVACFLAGFSQGAKHWNSAPTISLIVVGGILILLCLLHEIRTKRNPIVPPRLFTGRTSSSILVSAFIHGFIFFAATYYIPLYFQVIGSSPVRAGVESMAYTLGSSVAGSIAGLISTKTSYRAVIWISWLFTTIGYGLMILLDATTPQALKEIYILIAAIGVGGIFQVPLIALHAAMPPSDMALSTSAFMLLRLIGSTVGVSVADTIFHSVVKSHLPNIPGVIISDDLRQLTHIEPYDLRDRVLDAYCNAFSVIWIVCTSLAGIGFIFSFLIRKYTLDVQPDEAPRPARSHDRGDLSDKSATVTDKVNDSKT